MAVPLGRRVLTARPQPESPRRLRLLAISVVLAFGAAAVPGWAEDGDQRRYYLHLRWQDTNPVTEVHDHMGFSVGANLGRHWGLELSTDYFERLLWRSGETIAEYGVLAVIPQLRLRYPVLGNRLVPYVVGGVGVAFTELNDRKPRKPPKTRVTIEEDVETSLVVGTIGAGVEYYFADNLALGIEVKYLIANDTTLRLDGQRHSQEVGSLFTTLGLRLLIPELRERPSAGPGDPAPKRLYAGLRVGAAISTDPDAFSTVEVRPEPPAYFDTGNQLFGIALGMDFGRYLGIELVLEGYEVVLATADLGSVTELAVYDFIPQVRLGYPLMGGRLVPYAVGGVGVGYTERNDTKPPGTGLDIDTSTFGVAAAVGAGIEYFVASNIAVGLEARYLANRGHTVRIAGGREGSGHYDSLSVALTLRVVLAEFGR